MRRSKQSAEWTWDRIAAIHEQGGPVSETYGAILQRVCLVPEAPESRSLLFTSALEREGKTSLVLHLGAMLAARGKKALLVDGDFARPALTRMLGLEGRPGVTDALQAGARAEDAITADGRVPSLLVMPKGSRAGGLVDSASVERFGKVLQEVRGRFDFILVDSCSISTGLVPLVLGPLVDGVLLVVQCDRTQRTEAALARDAIRKHGGRIAGAVLSRVPGYLPDYYKTT